MTEKEKMLAGQWYDPNGDEGLIEERAFVKDLCLEFNQTRMQEMIRRRKILRQILPNVDIDAVEILSPFMVDYGYNIFLGAGTFLNHNCYLKTARRFGSAKKFSSARTADFTRRFTRSIRSNALKVWSARSRLKLATTVGLAATLRFCPA